MEQAPTSTSLYARFEAFLARHAGIVLLAGAAFEIINAIVAYWLGNILTAAFCAGCAAFFGFWLMQYSRSSPR